MAAIVKPQKHKKHHNHKKQRDYRSTIGSFTLKHLATDGVMKLLSDPDNRGATFQVASRFKPDRDRDPYPYCGTNPNPDLTLVPTLT